MPSALTHLGRRGVPSRSVLLVGAIAGGGLAIGYWRGWGAEAFLVVPNSLVIVVYIVGSAAGVRLLAGRARVLPATSTVLCSTLLPFAGISLALPVGVAVAALACRSLIGRVGS